MRCRVQEGGHGPAGYGYALRRYVASREKDRAKLGRYAREMEVERQAQQAMGMLP